MICNSTYRSEAKGADKVRKKREACSFREIIGNRKGGSVLEYAVAVGAALTLAIVLYNVVGDTVKPKLESMIPSIFQGDKVEVAAGGPHSPVAGDGNQEEKNLEPDTVAPSLDEGKKEGKLEPSEIKVRDGLYSRSEPFTEKEQEGVKEVLHELRQEGMLKTGLMVLEEEHGLAGVAFFDKNTGNVVTSSSDSSARRHLIGEKNLYIHLPGQFIKVVPVEDFRKKSHRKKKSLIIRLPDEPRQPRAYLPVEPPKPQARLPVEARPKLRVYLPIERSKYRIILPPGKIDPPIEIPIEKPKI